MADDKQKAINTLQNLILDSVKGKTEDFEVYQKAEDIVKKYPALTASVDALITDEVGASFDIDENKEIGFSVNPEEKKAQLGFKMSFDTGDTVKKSGFITPEILEQAKKTEVPREQRTISQAIDRKIKTLENSKKLPRAKAKTIEKSITLVKSYKAKLAQIIDINKIKMSDINNESAIKSIMDAAGEKFNLDKKGFDTFSKNISALMGSHAGTGHTWALFRGGSDALDIKLSDWTEGYEPERPLKVTKSEFNTAAQSLDDIPDWKKGKLAKLPPGTAKRFAKIVALTGIRPEHLAGLSIEDLSQLDDGIVTYDDIKGIGKRKKPVTVFYHINEAGKRLLKQQLALQQGNTTGRVFYGTADQFSGHISKFFNKNNLKVTLKDGTKESWQLYDFRRTQKARLIAQGKPQYIIDALMGHSYKGPYKENIIQGSKMAQDPNVKKVLLELETDFFEKAGMLNESSRYSFTGDPIPEGMGKPKFRVARDTANLKAQLDETFKKGEIKGGGASIDSQGRGRKWVKKAKTAGIIAGILGVTKTKAATVAPYVIPGPIDAPIMLAISEYGKKKNPPGYSDDSVSLFEEMQGRYDELKKVSSIGDKPLGLGGFKEREFEKRLSDTDQLELDDLQAFMDDLNMSEDESKKLIKDTKKQYYDKYVETGIKEGKTPPEHFKGMMQFYPEGYGQEQAG